MCLYKHLHIVFDGVFLAVVGVVAGELREASWNILPVAKSSSSRQC